MSRPLQFNTHDLDSELADLSANGAATREQLQSVRQRLDALRAAIARTNYLANVPGGMHDAGTQTGSSTLGAGSTWTSAAASAFQPGHQAIVLTGGNSDVPGSSGRAVSPDVSAVTRAEALASLAALDRTLGRGEALQQSVARVRREFADRTAATDRLYARETERLLAEADAPSPRATQVDDMLARWSQLDDAGFASVEHAATTAATAARRLERERERAVRSEHSLSRDHTSYLRLRNTNASASSNSASSTTAGPSSSRSVPAGSSPATALDLTRRSTGPAPTVLDFNQRRAALRASMTTQLPPSSSAATSSADLFGSLYEDMPDTTRALLSRYRRFAPSPPSTDAETTRRWSQPVPNYWGYSAAEPGTTTPVRRRTRGNGSSSASSPSGEMEGAAGSVMPRIPLAYGPLRDSAPLDRAQRSQLLRAASASDGRIQALTARYLQQLAEGSDESRASSPSPAEMEQWITRLASARPPRASTPDPPVVPSQNTTADSAWRTRMEFLTSTANLPLYDSSGSTATTTRSASPATPFLPLPPPFSQTTARVPILPLPQPIEDTMATFAAEEQQLDVDDVRRTVEPGALYW